MALNKWKERTSVTTADLWSLYKSPCVGAIVFDQ